MNPLLRTLSIFVSFFLFTVSLSLAQEKEYIILKNNDTIYGEVSRGTNILNTSEIRYNFTDELGNKSRIDPATVKFIKTLNGVDGNSIIATVYDQFFVTRIIDGSIKVYRLVNGSLFYISKDNGDIRFKEFGGFFSKKKAHAQIRPLLEDYPPVLEEFDLLKGSEANILNIIQKYNSVFQKQLGSW